MAKWIRVVDLTWERHPVHFLNVERIRQIKIDKNVVVIDDVAIAECKTKEEAEKYIKDFIEEHYIPTEKVS